MERRLALAIYKVAQIIPVYSFIDHWALGWGFSLSLTASLAGGGVAATEQAKFMTPEPNIGVHLNVSYTHLLYEVILKHVHDPRKAMAYAKYIGLTANPINATTANQYGLVNVLVENRQALDDLEKRYREAVKNATTIEQAKENIAAVLSQYQGPVPLDKKTVQRQEWIQESFGEKDFKKIVENLQRTGAISLKELYAWALRIPKPATGTL